MTHEHEHAPVVIEERRGGGAGMIVAAIVILAVVIGLWYFALGPGQGTFGAGAGTDINVDVTLPSVAPEAS
jgi:hypothetical protein